MSNEMNWDEKHAKEFLLNLNLGEIVYEPDGNIPPDFLIEGKIAVEVRRLNQYVEVESEMVGIEKAEYAVRNLFRQILSQFPAKKGESCYFVTLNYSRPLPNARGLRKKLKTALNSFLEEKKEKSILRIDENIDIEIWLAGNMLPHKFNFGCIDDSDNGGWIEFELKKSIEISLKEKNEKIRNFKDKYSEWWLLLVDHIAFGYDEEDSSEIKRLLDIDHNWNRLIMLDAADHTKFYEI